MARFAALVIFALLFAPLASAAPTDDPAALRALHATTGAAKDAAGAVASGASSAARGASSAAASVGSALGQAAAVAKAGLVAAGALLGSLAAMLGGALGRGARWVAAHPRESTDALGATTSFAWLVWVAKRLGAFGFLLPLYTRLAPSEILDNEARNGVYEHVRANPGAHPSGIAEALGLGWGTVVYHLSKLEAGKLVTSRAAHNRKCYFALTSDLNVEARTAVAAMSTDKARAIVDAVRAAPGISQKDLSTRLGMSQALASWHVKRLVESGVLHVGKSGRSHTLHVAGHVPTLAPLAA